MSVHCAPVTSSTVVVAVDVGKTSVALSVTDAGRCRLLGPVDFAMTRPGLVEALGCIRAVLPAGEAVVKAGWEVLQLNPAHVAEQRRVQGRRRVKTDAIDLEAITELVLAGRGDVVTLGDPVIGVRCF